MFFCFRDLRPDNLLIGCGLNLVLTYQCQWICVDRVVHTEAIEQLYAAPEVGSIQAMTAAADWWSYGAILFELLSGEVRRMEMAFNLISYMCSHRNGLVNILWLLGFS